MEFRLSENEDSLELKDKQYNSCITEHNEQREKEQVNQVCWFLLYLNLNFKKCH